MSTAGGLTAEEERALQNIYRRDVQFWSWSQWVALYNRFGEAAMGLTWVILPYKPAPTMPAIRRRMNELYYEALAVQAAEYGLSIRIDDAIQKIVLFDPTRVTTAP